MSNLNNQQRFSCTASDSTWQDNNNDTIVPYILVYKKRNNLAVSSPITLNARQSAPIILDETSNDDHSSTSASKVDDVIPIVVDETSDNESVISITVELDNESETSDDKSVMSITAELDDVSTPEMMNRQSLLKELNKQKEKIINADEKKKIDDSTLTKIKSPVKRKSKYSNVTSKKRVQCFRDNLDDDAKAKLKQSTKKSVSKHRANLDDDAKATIQDKNMKRKRTVRTCYS